MKVQIYKLVQNGVTIDAADNLDYYQSKPHRNLIEYKGTIAVSISEPEGYLRGYLKKSAAKMVMEEILNDRFERNFPQGYAFYGGKSNNGEITARIVNIGLFHSQERGEKYYFISIVEGEGCISERKGYVLKRNQGNKMVRIFMNIADIKEMAVEILDYTRTTEIKGSLQGKPLFTTITQG